MIKYEYMFSKIEWGVEDKIEQLNKFGEEGWELVWVESFKHYDPYYRCYFKRIKQEE